MESCIREGLKIVFVNAGKQSQVSQDEIAKQRSEQTKRIGAFIHNCVVADITVEHIKMSYSVRDIFPDVSDALIHTDDYQLYLGFEIDTRWSFDKGQLFMNAGPYMLLNNVGMPTKPIGKAKPNLCDLAKALNCAIEYEWDDDCICTYGREMFMFDGHGVDCFSTPELLEKWKDTNVCHLIEERFYEAMINKGLEL